MGSGLVALIRNLSAVGLIVLDCDGELCGVKDWLPRHHNSQKMQRCQRGPCFPGEVVLVHRKDLRGPRLAGHVFGMNQEHFGLSDGTFNVQKRSWGKGGNGLWNRPATLCRSGGEGGSAPQWGGPHGSPLDPEPCLSCDLSGA